MKQLSILCMIIMVSCQTNQDHKQAKIQIDTLALARHMEAWPQMTFKDANPLRLEKLKR